MNIIGSPLTVVTVDFYAFTGCASLEPISACPVQDLTDAYAVHFNDGGYGGWTPTVTADTLPGENTVPTPEPRTMLLIGLGLVGLGVRRCHKH